VRVDTGVREGDDVSMYYDPMIAKLIVWDVDRNAALRRMREALGAYEIVGLPNNVEFLQRVVRNQAFVAGKVDTTFIAAQYTDLLPERAAAPPARALATVALFDAIAAARSSASSSAAWRASTSARFGHEHVHALKLGTEAPGVTADTPASEAVRWHSVHVRRRAAADAQRDAVDVRVGDGGQWVAAELRECEALPSGVRGLRVCARA
jgi:3-methylcrotonyl-CoA carboxylase alpha subunit